MSLASTLASTRCFQGERARRTLPPFLGRPESAITGAYVAELIEAF